MQFMLAGIAFIAACQSKSSQVKAFIGGVYVRHSAGAYAVADDTLAFRLLDGDQYSVLRKVGYRAIRQGRLLPKKMQMEELEGVFDAQHLVLNENTTGRVFRFDPISRVLWLKQAEYRKLD